jgi:phosphoglycerate kinase
MTSKLRSLEDLSGALGRSAISGKPTVVFLRLDLNVPLKDGRITDDTRIRAALPTIKWLMDKGARIVACSHLGRPSGKGFEAEHSLEPVGVALASLSGSEVLLVPDPLDVSAERIVSGMESNQIVLLENLRFWKEEKNGDTEFAKRLARLAQFYVNDAFGTAHRPDASVVAVAQCFPPDHRAAGLLIEKEIDFLEGAFDKPKPPVTAVFGGAKVSDKIDVLLKFTEIANHIVIGGAMSYTFLAQMGVKVGASRTEADKLDVVAQIRDAAEKRNVRIHLPSDHIAASTFSETAAPVNVDTRAIPDGLMGLDIGPKTRAEFAGVIAASKVVVWNGPMGVFEWPAFAQGTRSIAEALVAATAEKGTTTIVGGGDSAAAITQFGLQDRVSHVSTGGGASLELLEGKRLPGIECLRATARS